MCGLAKCEAPLWLDVSLLLCWSDRGRVGRNEPNRPQWLQKFPPLVRQERFSLKLDVKTLSTTHCLTVPHVERESPKQKQNARGIYLAAALSLKRGGKKRYFKWRLSLRLTGSRCVRGAGGVAGGNFDAVGCRRLNLSTWRGAIGAAAFLNNNKRSQCAASR